MIESTQQQQPSKQNHPEQIDGDAVSERHATYQRASSDSMFQHGNIYAQDDGSFAIAFPQPDVVAPAISDPHRWPDPSDGFLDSLSSDRSDKAYPLSRADSLASPSPDLVLSLSRSSKKLENNYTELRPNPVLYPTLDPLYNLLNFDPADVFWRRSNSQASKPFLQPPRALTDREKWHSTDDVYQSAITAYRDLSEGADLGLSYIPFAAVIKGWDTLDEKNRTHPIWASLHWIDESVYGSWQSNAQRIAMMYLKHRLMLVR
jgi:hypothetical protein